MLVSTSHRFVFIHINRTGGTSITQALQPFSVPRPTSRVWRRVTRYGLLRDPQRMDFPPHTPARVARRRLPGGLYDAYLSAAFVRNPWSWLPALYNAIMKSEGHRHRQRVLRMSGFSDFVDWQVSRGQRTIENYVIDDEGRVMVDFVGRFENLRGDFAELCRRIGVGDLILPHARTRRDHPDYREYYDSATRDKVGEYWKGDIERFGYEFDGVRSDRQGFFLGRKQEEAEGC